MGANASQAVAPLMDAAREVNASMHDEWRSFAFSDGLVGPLEGFPTNELLSRVQPAPPRYDQQVRFNESTLAYHIRQLMLGELVSSDAFVRLAGIYRSHLALAAYEQKIAVNIVKC
jgi:hypothetical protein